MAEKKKSRHANTEDEKHCEKGVRDKYAKKWEPDKKITKFELYTADARPGGLSSIFYIGDQRSLNNWGLETGSNSRQNKGHIREAVDHQINAPVLEIAGLHDGSVCMMCPPDHNSLIDIKKPYVTILMRHIQGYSSIEFQVLDSLGFSRQIHAKNFKSRCTIGELNLEIPMRLSCTWSYASVNLDKTLTNAFGTKLVSIQKIKINANCRVRRVYFSDEIVSFEKLPLDYQIKLSLTDQEKLEIEKYERMLSSEPMMGLKKRYIPWALPQFPQLDHQIDPLNLHTPTHILRKNMEIKEIPSEDVDLEKYKYAKDPRGNVTDSNSKLLRTMLEKSIPPSKILLPTLSLIYPSGKQPHTDPNGRQQQQLHKAGAARENRRKQCVGIPGQNEDINELFKLKKRLEQIPGGGEDENRKNDGSTGLKSSIVVPAEGKKNAVSDWDMINFEENQEEDNKEDDDNNSADGYSYNTKDLARYLKHREVVGEYDLFTGIAKNPDFLPEPVLEEESVAEEEPAAGVDDIEVLQFRNDSSQNSDYNRHNPFIHHKKAPGTATQARMISAQSSRSSVVAATKGPTVSVMTLHDPSKAFHHNEDEEETTGSHGEDTGGEKTKPSAQESHDSWVFTWAYTGLSWAQTREINQKLLSDARAFDNGTVRRSFLDGATNKPQNTNQTQNSHNDFFSQQRNHAHTHRSVLPDFVKTASPIMPKVMKEELKGTSGYYDLVFDNPTLPIEYY